MLKSHIHLIYLLRMVEIGKVHVHSSFLLRSEKAVGANESVPGLMSAWLEDFPEISIESVLTYSTSMFLGRESSNLQDYIWTS